MCLFSCSQQEKSIYDKAYVFNTKNFVETISLEGTTLKLNNEVMRPIDIQVYDTLLITIELSSDKLLHIYNLQNGEKIGERVNRGQGPNDMIVPHFMENNGNSIQILDMGKSTIYQYDIKEFINNPNPIASKKISLEKQAFINAQQIDNSFICYSYDLNKQLYVYNMNGKKINEIAELPSSSIEYTDVEKRDAFYMNFTSNNKDKIVICYCMTDLIEIYNSNGTLQHRLHGPEQFIAHFKENHANGTVTSSPKKNVNRDAYFTPRNAGNSFFVLFDGTYVDDTNKEMSCKQLFSFSWNGKPEKIFNLNIPLITYAVDNTKRKIYGISDKPDFHIVVYNY